MVYSWISQIVYNNHTKWIKTQGYQTACLTSSNRLVIAIKHIGNICLPFKKLLYILMIRRLLMWYK